MQPRQTTTCLSMQDGASSWQKAVETCPIAMLRGLLHERLGSAPWSKHPGSGEVRSAIQVAPFNWMRRKGGLKLGSNPKISTIRKVENGDGQLFWPLLRELGAVGGRQVGSYKYGPREVQLMPMDPSKEPHRGKRGNWGHLHRYPTPGPPTPIQ